MNEILTTDEFGLGFTGYTRTEAEVMLQGETEPAPESPDWFCANRGKLLEIGECDLCGVRGQPFEILVCSVYGKCSIGRRNSKIKSCFTCEDRIPVASGELQQVS